MNIKKILVSQPKPTSDKSPYFELARKHDVEIVFRPFIKIEGLSSRDFRRQRINLADFTAVLFTAKTAVDNFFRLCEEMRVNIPDTMKYFCTTEAIALYLQKYIVYRKRKIFIGKTGKLPDLLPLMTKHKNEKYLLAASDVSNPDDVKPFIEANYDVTRAVMYRTVSNDFGPDEPFDYDMLVFFSPQGIESLLKNFPEFEQGDIRIAAFGVNSCKAVTDAGLRLDIEAPTEKARSMTDAIDNFLTEHRPADHSDQDVQP